MGGSLLLPWNADDVVAAGEDGEVRLAYNRRTNQFFLFQDTSLVEIFNVDNSFTSDGRKQTSLV